MHLLDRHRFALILAAAIAAVCGAVSPAAATPQDMARLPVIEPFRCLICHNTNPGDTGDASLNVFGADFLANLRTWNAELASQDSDNDGCANGIELGDADGDGVADGNVTRLTSNPGVEDCGSSINSTAWGELKALFESR
jgi:hypothetical protein